MALSGIETPVMQWDGENLKENWRRFKQHVELMFSGPLKSRNEVEKCSYLLIWVGQKGRDIFNTWADISEEDQGKLKTYYDRFEKHVNPKANPVFARYKFHNKVQGPTEPVEQFITELQLLAQDCEFHDKNEMVRDRIVFGTNSSKVREKLIMDGADLTLEKATRIARTYETSQAQLKTMSAENKEENIHTIKQRNQDSHNQRARQQNFPQDQEYSQPTQCGNCGRRHHRSDKCPAKGQICHQCNKPNHFAQVCRSKGRRSQINPINKGENDPTSSQFESITFESITIANIDNQKTSKDEVFVTVSIDLSTASQTKTSLKAKLDTGAQGNILPVRLYREMYPQNIDEYGNPKKGATDSSDTILTACGGSRINHHGTTTICCEFKGKSSMAQFYVTNTQGPAIIGLPTSTDLNLVKFNCAIHKKSIPPAHTPPSTSQSSKQVPTTRPVKNKQDLITQYPNCFNGIGKFQGEYHITTDPSVPPVIHPPRRVPISLKDDIKKELDEMVANGIITKIQEGEPTRWVNSLVYRRKPNGRLRLCLDPKDLNAAILREHHVVPTLEEILPELRQAKFFSIVDAKCGYWNVVLDEESSYLTTFNSPFGRYRFKRMPFGLKMSQDIFQAKIDQTFEGCEGVIGIADDIVISGKTEEEHDRNLHRMINRCQHTGMKLNPDKCFIKQEKIKFYGLICGPDGIQPDPNKVSALKQMAPPVNSQELHTFLGLATYMAPFIPNLSHHTASLRELLKKENKFVWDPAHQEVFEKIKSSITDEITLTYFDPKKETVIQVDASIKGLGATLMQENKPVAFASKALTDVESRYANIERELLAVVYGCEKFHTYLYGRSFIVQSDHKPLETIHLKHLTAAPPRLQRMLMRLQPYDLTIKYRQGKNMEVADALSRLSPEEKEAIPNMDVQIHEVYPQFSDEMLERIRATTDADPELQALKEVVHTGWPTNIKQVSETIKPYWTFREEITVEDGITMKGQRIIIPQQLQKAILTKLHAGHQGSEKNKLRARTSVYWRGMNNDIDDVCRSCNTCQEMQNSQAKEPLIQTDVPPGPWHTIGTDLFYLDDLEYLLVADYSTTRNTSLSGKYRRDRAAAELWLISQNKSSASKGSREYSKI